MHLIQQLEVEFSSRESSNSRIMNKLQRLGAADIFAKDKLNNK